MDYPEGATPLDPDEMLGIKFPHITTRGELDQMEHEIFSKACSGFTELNTEIS